MPGSQDKFERLEAFIEKQRGLAEADGDGRRSRANTYNATADVLLERGYFDTDETPSNDPSPQLSEAIDSRITRLNSSDALDALERIEAHLIGVSARATKTQNVTYSVLGLLVLIAIFTIARLN